MKLETLGGCELGAKTRYTFNDDDDDEPQRLDRIKAGERIRTVDIHVGNVTLYH